MLEALKQAPGRLPSSAKLLGKGKHCELRASGRKEKKVAKKEAASAALNKKVWAEPLALALKVPSGRVSAPSKGECYAVPKHGTGSPINRYHNLSRHTY